MDVGLSEAGMPCVACTGSKVRCGMCMGHDLRFMQFHRGLDATWCSLVDQPFLGLVCAYAMGTESEMPPESCRLAGENCSLGMCVRI